MSMSMSSSMDPPPSGLPMSASYPERMNSSVSGYPSSVDDVNKPAAMLVTSNPTSANVTTTNQGGMMVSSSNPMGGIPPPFRSSQQTRQYPAPNSLPTCLPTSASAPSIPNAAAAAGSGQNGEHNARLLRSPQSKIETLKNWSISTYKCTKQLMFEKLGKTSRTVDTGNNSKFICKHS